MVRVKKIAYVINRLLPIPRCLDVLECTHEVEEWLNIKRSRLRWDKSVERYVLENFRILQNLSPQIDRQNFTVREHKKFHKSLILEILPDRGSN